MAVLVLDKRRRPLIPCSEKRARLLLDRGRARVHRMQPFTIRFQTGDYIRAVVPSGKKAGTHVGRVAIRASGSFNIQTPTGVVQGIGHRHCALLQRADGYGYSVHPKIAPTSKEDARGRLTAGAIPPRPEGRGLARENR